MKQRYPHFFCVLFLVFVLTGCGENGATTVSTEGATSMEKVIGFLSEVYEENHPEISVTYNPTGSGAGIQAVQEGRCDIGLSSRSLTDSEAETLSANIVAIDGIAVVVHPQNPLENVSLAQLGQLYRGELANWADLGGNNAPVVCIGREAASGTRDGFEAIIDAKDRCIYTQELTSTGDVMQTVASNPNAIGYAALASVKDTVKVLSIDNVFPSTETMQPFDP